MISSVGIKINIIYCIWLTLCVSAGASHNTKQHDSHEYQYRHREILDESTETILEWEVDPTRAPESVINFTLSSLVASEKWDDRSGNVFLFGLSARGNVIGSDVVAVTMDGDGGVMDMYGLDNDTLSPDSKQDWRLISFERNLSHVSFTLSRFLDTCDSNDVPIKNDLLKVIWGFTQVDTRDKIYRLHFRPQGSLSAHLLDPTIPAPKAHPGNLIQSWRFSHKIHMPARRTMYSCTIQRGPLLSRKHHAFGVIPYFKDELSRQTVHHMFVHRCIPRPGMDARHTFEKYVGHQWEECFLQHKHELPTIFCTEILVGWAVGGKPFYLPSDVGVPIGESKYEYYMLETHLDNPGSRTDLVVEVGMEIPYSSKLRQSECSILPVGYGMASLFQVPPHVKDFKVAGHCSSGCTRQILPPSGADILAVLHHTHFAGQRIILRHFRGSTELEWISSDLNYDFNVQSVRLLPKRVTFLPGDHLTTECEYDASDRNGSSVAGYPTTDEMCAAVIVLNKVVPYMFCSSEYPTYRTMARYGIRGMIWNKQRGERVITAARNQSFVGLSLQNVMDRVDGTVWSAEKVKRLEREQLYQWHDATCIPVRTLSVLGHGFNLIEEMSYGFLPLGEFIERFRPTTDTMSSSVLPGLQSTRYPTISSIYRRPQTCKGKRLLN